MIDQETVIVLGAGASAPFGFPTGPRLVQDILENHVELQELLKPYPEFENFPTHRTDHDVQKFMVALRSSEFDSIDAFIQARPEFREIGRIAISMILCKRESDSISTGKLFGRQDGHWYREFLNKLFGPSIKQFEKNRLSILTFNYDRTFEFYLHETIQHRYGIDDNMATDLMKHIPIYHIHGRLGYLEWQDPFDDQNQKTERSMTCISPRDIKNAANSIEIVDEVSQKSREVVLAQDALRRAQHIFFIGFGYRNENKWLFEETITFLRAKKLRGDGSAFEMTVAEREHIKGAWSGGSNSFEVLDHDASGFLRNSHRLLQVMR